MDCKLWSIELWLWSVIKILFIFDWKSKITMTIHIYPKTKRQELASAVRKLKQGKKLDAKKFCGTVKWEEDGLVAQKHMRDEWN